MKRFQGEAAGIWYSGMRYFVHDLVHECMFQEVEFEPEPTAELDELVDLWDALALREGEIETGSNIFDFVEADNDLATSEEPTIADIVRNAIENENEGLTDEGESTDEDLFFVGL